LPKWVEQIQKVTSADVQRVLREHLGADKRVTVVTEPKPKAAGGAEKKP